MLRFYLTRLLSSLDYFSVSSLSPLNFPSTCSLVLSLAYYVGFVSLFIRLFVSFFGGYFVGLFVVDILCCDFTWRGRCLCLIFCRLLCC